MKRTHLMEWMNHLDQRIQAWVTENKTNTIVDVIVFSAIVGISFFVLGPNLEAEWWILDDHEIVYAAGPDKALSASEILPTLLTKTEISSSSTSGHFRPFYHFFRLVENRLWYKNAPFGWYLFRIFIYLFFISTLYLFFRKINGRIIGGLLAIYMTTFAFWTDIFSRIGPSEAYTVMGSGFFLIGILLYLKNKDSIPAWLMMLIGSVVAIGSKENMFILLLPLLIVLVIYLRSKPKHKMWAIVCTAISLAWSFYVYGSVYQRLRLNKTDVYGNSITIQNRLAALTIFLGDHLAILSILAFLTILSLVGLLVWKKSKIRNLMWVVLGGSLSIILLIATQAVIYNGDIWGRYLFPYQLYLPFTISLLIYIFQKLALLPQNKIVYAAVTLIAAVGLVTQIKPANWVWVRDFSVQNTNRTHYYTSKVNSLTDFLVKNPDVSLMIYGTSAEDDAEPTYSYIKFLRSEYLDNAIYVLRDPPADYETAFSAYRVVLEKDLLNLSAKGDEELKVSPLSDFSGDPQECILLTLKMDHNAPIQCNYTMNGDVMLHYSGYYDQY